MNALWRGRRPAAASCLTGRQARRGRPGAGVSCDRLARRLNILYSMRVAGIARPLWMPGGCWASQGPGKPGRGLKLRRLVFMDSS
jgi:hypothetical protein